MEGNIVGFDGGGEEEGEVDEEGDDEPAGGGQHCAVQRVTGWPGGLAMDSQ